MYNTLRISFFFPLQHGRNSTFFFKHQSPYKQNTSTFYIVVIQCQLNMIRKLLKLHYVMSEHNAKCVSMKIKYYIK